MGQPGNKATVSDEAIAALCGIQNSANVSHKITSQSLVSGLLRNGIQFVWRQIIDEIIELLARAYTMQSMPQNHTLQLLLQ